MFLNKLGPEKISWKETKELLTITEDLDEEDEKTLDVLIAMEEAGMRILKFDKGHMYVEVVKGSKLDNRKKVKGIAKALNLTIEVRIKEL